MTNVDEDRDRKDVLSDEEFNVLLAQARGNEDKVLANRNPAILCVLRLTGKRREEVAALKFSDVWLEKNDIPGINDRGQISTQFLNINFMLLKKSHHKKLPDGTVLPASPPPERVRPIPLEDPLTKPIVDYMNFLKNRFDETPKFFWVNVRPCFGHNIYQLDKGITGRTIYNVVRDTADGARIVVWPHLFRETAGAEEVKQDPSLYGVFKVANRIDVTERTAWNYMRRHAMNVIRRDYEKSGRVE